MKAWIKWLKGDDFLRSRNPIAVIGRFILSVWIAILGLVALIIAGIFITHPEDFTKPERDQTCYTVEYNGELVDTCDYLTP